MHMDGSRTLERCWRHWDISSDMVEGITILPALCLESGVDINEMLGGRTLLHAFAHQGDLVGTRWLVDHGAKINVTDAGNNTPLHKACERNSTLKVVELLVERGASLTAVNNNGETALDMAIRPWKRSSSHAF